MKNLKEISVIELKKSENEKTFGGGSKPKIVRVEPIVKPLNPGLDLIIKPYSLG